MPNSIRWAVFACATALVPSIGGLASAHPIRDLAAFHWVDGARDGVWRVHPDGSPENKVGARAPYGFNATVQVALSPNGNRVAYEGGREFNNDLYVSNMRTGETVRLTHRPGMDEHPSWSPDGRKIVADCGRQLCKLRPDGVGRPKMITHNDSSENSPEWSPNGKWIVFEGERGLMLIKPDGSRLRRLTRGAFDYDPNWSPDSKQVVFVRSPSGTPRLFRVGIRTRDPKKVGGGSGVQEEPEWSPDGGRIVFSRTRDVSTDDDVRYVTAMWTVRPRGGDPQRVSPKIFNSGFATLFPSWFPGGKRIAFTMGWRPNLDAHSRVDVFSVKRDGSDIRRLTDSESYGDFFGIDW